MQRTPIVKLCHYDAWSYQKKKHKKIKAYIFRKNLQLKDFY